MALQCRACLTNAGMEYVSLDSSLSSSTYRFYFNQWTEITTNVDDHCLLCASCAQQLQLFHAFVQTAQWADEQLRNKLAIKNGHEDEDRLVFVEVEREDEDCAVEELADDDIEEGLDEMQVDTVEELIEESVTEVEYLEEKPHVEELLFSETTPQDFPTVQRSAIKEELTNTSAFNYYPEDELDDEYLQKYDESEENAEADVAHHKFRCSGTKWKCIECKLILRGDVSYEGHMNLHKDVRPHKCPQCQCTFRCKNSLDRHARLRHQMKITGKHLSCDICQKVFRLQALLEEHKKREHEHQHQQPSFICPKCEKPFDLASELKEHQQLHHSTSTIAPKPAQKSTPYQPYQCELCKRYLRSANTLQSHMRAVHAQNTEGGEEAQDGETDEQCKLCKRYVMRRNMDKHMALHERKERKAADEQTKFLCAYCSRECKNKKTLYQHEKMHEGESPLVVYVCSDCDRQYNTQYLLLQHRKQAHKERDNFCHICGNAFKLKNQLINHMKLHLEKNIQCPNCDKKYARQVDLNVHMRSHTGETPYECNLCGKRFAIKVRLTYHLQKHYGVKHVCKECSAEFNSKQKLKAHSFKHTGMPYRCEVCDNHGFANRDVFKRHMMRVHSATMTDEELVEMFQRNTGKTTRIRTVSDADHVSVEGVSYVGHKMTQMECSD